MNALLSPKLLTQDHFALFGLAPSYAIDEAALSASYQALQQQVHPDRFAQGSESDKRIAMQSSAQVNEAYKTLRDPLTRAAYLCEHMGAAVKAERHVGTMPAEFLMQQMQWREALAEAEAADDKAAIDALEQQVLEARRDGYALLAKLLDKDHNYAAAAAQVRALMFIEKFSRDVSEVLDELET